MVRKLCLSAQFGSSTELAELAPHARLAESSCGAGVVAGPHKGSATANFTPSGRQAWCGVAMSERTEVHGGNLHDLVVPSHVKL